MKVLVVGSGGREHALCWSLAASPLVDELFCAPGSDAIGREASCVPLAIDDLDGIVAFCRERAVELVVPGPELPLVLGLVDRLASAGIKAAGPSSAAATASRPPATGSSAARRPMRRGPMCAPRARRSWSRPTASPPARG